MTKEELVQKIQELKKEKNAIVLAHYYSNPDVQDVADFLGDSLELSRKAGTADADIIMLDNMDNATMTEAVNIIKASGKAIKTEASGNMSIPRLVEVAATGVDYISVGALTHTVKGMDISMNIQVEK